MNWDNCDVVIGIQFNSDDRKKVLLTALKNYITLIELSNFIPSRTYLMDEQDQQIGIALRTKKGI
jgi:hypothetical protein